MAHLVDASQFRAARAILGSSLIDAAKAAGVSVATVMCVEGHASASTAAQDAVQKAYETAGVQFLSDDGSGSGLRLKALA